MSITAQWVGGPRDGELIELAGTSSFRIALPPPRPTTIKPSVEVADNWDCLGPVTIVVQPTLTRNGWRLYWPKDAV